MKSRNQILLENKIRKMVREELLKEANSGILRTTDVSKVVDEAVSKLEKIADTTDSILIAETIIDYLNRKYIRYKDAYQKYGE